MAAQKLRLKQTKQCKTCPWRKDSTVADIPNYDPNQHEKLAGTISSGDIYEAFGPIEKMACHNSTDGNEFECVGWLYNQLNQGNNIALRLRMRDYENAKDIQVDGEQKASFAETFQ